jgi:hypothetical protein
LGKSKWNEMTKWPKRQKFDYKLAFCNVVQSFILLSFWSFGQLTWRILFGTASEYSLGLKAMNQMTKWPNRQKLDQVCLFAILLSIWSFGHLLFKRKYVLWVLYTTRSKHPPPSHPSPSIPFVKLEVSRTNTYTWRRKRRSFSHNLHWGCLPSSWPWTVFFLCPSTCRLEWGLPSHTTYWLLLTPSPSTPSPPPPLFSSPLNSLSNSSTQCCYPLLPPPS